jgi:glutathione S-transferase
MAATSSRGITLFQLPNSRALRIAWLLEELELPYNIVTGSRLPDFNATPDFKAQCGGLGKSPTIHDGQLIVQESGAIVDYLCETYPSKLPSEPLIPPVSSVTARAKVRELMHMAEGTFMVHAYPAFITTRLPGNLLTSKDIRDFRVIAAQRVYEDLAWLETHLSDAKTMYLVGDHLTAADIMMGFSIQLILERVIKDGELSEVGGKKEYPSIQKWVGGLMGRKALRMALKKTGFTASNDERVLRGDNAYSTQSGGPYPTTKEGNHPFLH